MKKILTIFLFLPFGLYSQGFYAPIISTFHGIINGSINPDSISIKDSITIFINDLKYSNAKVMGFTVNTSGAGYDAWFDNIGNKLSEESYNAIKNCPIGKTIWIEEIKIKKDSAIIETNNIKLKLDGLKACVFANPKERDYSFLSFIDTNSRRVVGTVPIYISGVISKKALIKNDYLLIFNPEFEYGNPVRPFIQITEYCITLIYKNKTTKSFQENSDKISLKIKKAIRKSKNLREIFIDKIKAIDTNGKTIKIQSLFLDII